MSCLEVELQQGLMGLTTNFPGTEADLRESVERLLSDTGAQCTCPPLVRVGETNGLVCVHLRSDGHVIELVAPFTRPVAA